MGIFMPFIGNILMSAKVTSHTAGDIDVELQVELEARLGSDARRCLNRRSDHYSDRLASPSSLSLRSLTRRARRVPVTHG